MNRHLSVHLLTVILYLCLGVYSNSAQAQTSFSIGPRLGLNVTSAKYIDDKSSQYDIKTPAISRIETGITGNISNRHFALQPSLLYSQKGFVFKSGFREAIGGQTSITDFHEVFKLNYLTSSINFVYTQKRDGRGFQGFAGGYFGILLNGKVTYDNFFSVVGTTRISYQAELPIRAGKHFQNDGNFYSQHHDAGLQAGVGYRYADALVQIAYSVGVANIGVDYPMNIDPSGPSYYNRLFQASIVYLFKTKQTKIN